MECDCGSNCHSFHHPLHHSLYNNNNDDDNKVRVVAEPSRGEEFTTAAAAAWDSPDYVPTMRNKATITLPFQSAPSEDHDDHRKEDNQEVNPLLLSRSKHSTETTTTVNEGLQPLASHHENDHDDNPPEMDHDEDDNGPDYEAMARRNGMHYTLTQVPPSLWITFLLGGQQFLTMLGSTVLIPLVIVPPMGGTPAQTAHVLGTLLVVSGVATLLQTCLGNRLPIVQGGSFTYLPATLGIIRHPQLQAIVDPQERLEQCMQVVSGAFLVRANRMGLLERQESI